MLPLFSQTFSATVWLAIRLTSWWMVTMPRASTLVGAAQGQRLAVQRQRTRVRRVDAGDHLGERALAGPVLTQEPVHPPGRHR